MPVIATTRNNIMAFNANRTCPQIRFIETVLNRTDRLHWHEQNAKLARANGKRPYTVEMIPASDGKDVTTMLQQWRELGIRFVTLWNGQKRAIGALGCNLSYLRALKRQLDEQIPYLMAMEDDVKIAKPNFFHEAACFGAHLMGRSLELPGRTPIDFITFGYLASELFMTSLNGARAILSAYCDTGIVSNKDYQLFAHRGGVVLRIQPSGPGAAVARMGGTGHIRPLGHVLNGSRLNRESSTWPRPKWCPMATPRGGWSGELMSTRFYG